MSVADASGTPFGDEPVLNFVWGSQGSMMMITQLVLSETSNLVNVRAEIVQADGDGMTIGTAEFNSDRSERILRCLPTDDGPWAGYKPLD